MTPRSPDFICIGAQKAGTSWLRENLRSHPGVWMPPLPELHYFDATLEGSGFPAPEAAVRAADPEFRAAPLAKIQELAGSGDAAAVAWWATYFFVYRGDEWYRSLLAFAPATSVVGDVTPRYMLCGDEEVLCMKRVAPEAKLITGSSSRSRSPSRGSSAGSQPACVGPKTICSS